MIGLPKMKEKNPYLRIVSSKQSWIIGIVIVFLILILIRGTPDYFSLGPFGWNVAQEGGAGSFNDVDRPQESLDSSASVNLAEAIEVVDLEPRQNVYLRGENAFADFKIKKNLDLAFVIDVRWICPTGEDVSIWHDEREYNTYE